MENKTLAQELLPSSRCPTSCKPAQHSLYAINWWLHSSPQQSTSRLNPPPRAAPAAPGDKCLPAYLRRAGLPGAGWQPGNGARRRGQPPPCRRDGDTSRARLRGAPPTPLALPARRPLRTRHRRASRAHLASERRSAPRRAPAHTGSAPSLSSAPCPSAGEGGPGGQRPWQAEADGHPGTAALPGQNFSSGRSEGGEGPGAGEDWRAGGGAGGLARPPAAEPARSSAKPERPPLRLQPAPLPVPLSRGRRQTRAHTLFPQRGEGGGTVGLEPAAVGARGREGGRGEPYLRLPPARGRRRWGDGDPRAAAEGRDARHRGGRGGGQESRTRCRFPGADPPPTPPRKEADEVRRMLREPGLRREEEGLLPRRHGRREGSPAVRCELASLGAEGGDQERGTGMKRELALGSREIPPRHEGPSLTSPPHFCTPAFSSPAVKQHILKVEIQKERALPNHKTLLRTYTSRAERGKPAANPKMKKTAWPTCISSSSSPVITFSSSWVFSFPFTHFFNSIF